VPVLSSVQAFVAAQVEASADPDDTDPSALAERLESCARRGRSAWPSVELDPTTFAGHLGRHCRTPTDLDALAITDLYLACACARRDDAALRILHERIGPEFDRALARLGLDRDEADDVRLAVMQRLVVDTPPKIGSYAGRGSLAQWIAAVAARDAISRRRTEARRRGLLEAAAEDLAPADPELGFLKSHYRAEFKEAFGAAVSALSPTDLTVLRHRFIDGLTLDQLAAAAGVHRATAARWLARIRSDLLDSTRLALRERLGVDAAEVESVVRLIASNFEVSVRRLLAR
jgi:RNA polymerase sigma-70 factor (ECF subfamily)